MVYEGKTNESPPPLQQTFITTHEENASEMEDGELSQDESPINSEAETVITEPARNEKVPTTPIVDNRGKSIYLDLGLCPAGKVRKMLKFRYRFTRFTITRFTTTKEDQRSTQVDIRNRRGKRQYATDTEVQPHLYKTLRGTSNRKM